MKKVFILLLLSNSFLLNAQETTTIRFEDFESITFKEKYNEELDLYYWRPDFGDLQKSLNKKKVVISGYIYPMDIEENFYILTEDYYERLNYCSFDISPKDMIDIRSTMKLSGLDRKKKYMICGTLELNTDDIYKMTLGLNDAVVISSKELKAEVKTISNEDTPLWQQILYSENPNADELRSAYEEYYKQHFFVKTIHTQNYKRWIVLHRSTISEDGRLVIPTAEERKAREENLKSGQGSRGDLIWTYAGPQVHYDADGSLTPGFRHSNVYCHDRATTNTQVLFCGTESGGAYKTVDGGQNWEHVTEDHIIGDVSALRIHPENENHVLMSAANDIWRSVDGGETWTVIGQPSFISQNIRAWEIAFNPEDPSIVYIATNYGFFRSVDGGDNWTEVLTEQCNTIAIKPDDPSVIYTIQMLDMYTSKFYKSTDYGATWNMYDSGWFDNSGNVNMDGGRLATSADDPNRIYALLIGYQDANSTITTNGWIGAWVSYDAGLTWSFPHGLIGTPYTEDHPNLMNFQGDDGDYTQIGYNTTMIVSQLDADKVLIGGLNLWKSDDACASYEGVGGYIGGIEYFHVDQQEYRIYQTGPDSEEIWFSNDGGFGYSNDFMQTHQNLNKGIQAVNLWGYDQGWNEDMMVGGRYHNGNMAYHELYPAGDFLALGGGEAATGYVNYSDENKTYFSDIGGYIIPDELDGQSQYFSTTLYPNESYWNNNSSRILFDNNYFNVAWLGKENKIYKSVNGAASFSEVHAFGNNIDNWVLWIEQSYADNNYLYLHQAVGNNSKLWRTNDAGESWEEIDIPLNYREMVFTLSATNPEELWVAYYYGTNGNKVYHTTNGGQDWENITTTALNGEEIWAIAHQYGTDGGVYIAVKNGLVFYRNNSMDNWESYSTGLPASTEPLRIVPFYKGEKIRLACWNLGVWEAPFYEPSELIADFAAEFGTFFCPGEPVHFVDHSVAGPGASYSWSFPGGIPSTSTDKYPTVTYEEDGAYDVTLTVTYDGNSETVTKTSYISGLSGSTSPIAEDFESGSFPDSWITVGNGSWATTDDASAYGDGSYCMRFDNYYYDAAGARDEIWLGKQENAGGVAVINFDVAYAEYGPPYTDTLAVLYSLDCGDTWTEIFVQGGDDLATSPDFTDFFVPSSEQWEQHEINFIPGGSGDLIVAFQNRGHYGNAIYVDNINITSFTGVEEMTEVSLLSVYPNPASDFIQLSGKNMRNENAVLSIYDAQGKIVYSEKIQSVGTRVEKRIDVNSFAAGLYTISWTSESSQITSKVEIK